MTVLKKITPIRIKHALQYYAYRVDLFTSLGFKYFENIDGHDFKELIKYLNVAKNSSNFEIDVCDFINLPYYPSEYEEYLKYIKWDEIPNTFLEEK